MPGTVITDLRRHGAVDPGRLLAGPLRAVGLQWLEPGHSVEATAEGAEHALYVTAGSGLGALPEDVVQPDHPERAGTGLPLIDGTALVLPLGSRTVLTAGTAGLEYFHAVLAVPAVESSPEEAGEAGPAQLVVTTGTGSAMVLLGRDGARVRIRSLARRAMITSACEAFDQLRLSPGAHHVLPGRPDAETVLHVLRGAAAIGQRADEPDHLASDGDLLLARRGRTLHLEAGPLGAELLCLTLAVPRHRAGTRAALARRRAERCDRP
ncbi:hypothetical protein ACFV1W_05540 [Kitasatospora sp. NPDC059648]|uniref:hypothetical protein n=1 Tax=Kitasatospora sp. NPDC059648 TaxID=3346894 RepID=UPI003676763A